MQRTEQEYTARRNALITLFYNYLTGTVLRTANNNLHSGLNISLGLIGEVGEVVDWVKKVMFHNKPADLGKIINELGDVLFYAVWHRLYSIGGYSDLAYRNKYLSENLADVLVDNEAKYAKEFGPATAHEAWQLVRYAYNGVQNGDGAVQFVMAACGFFGLNIDQVIEANAAKLAARHPNGWGDGRRYDEPGLDERGGN